MLTIVDAKKRKLEDILINHAEKKLALSPRLFDAYGRDLLTGKEKFNTEKALEKVREGKILGTAQIVEQGEQLVFTTNAFSFSDYFALRHFASGLVAKGEPVDDRLIAAQSALSMIVLVETADKHLVIGYRSGDHLANRYLSPAGFYDYQDVPDKEFIRSKVFEKVKLSLGTSSFVPVNYLGLSHDNRDSFLFVQVLYQTIPFTSAEVYNNWQRIPGEKKHEHLLFVNTELKPLIDFIFHQGEHTLNPYHDPSIRFKQKKMIEGPEKHVGHEYDHIENGIGSLLLYLNHKYGSAAATSLCNDIVSQKLVSGINADALTKGIDTHFLVQMKLN